MCKYNKNYETLLLRGIAYYFISMPNLIRSTANVDHREST